MTIDYDLHTIVEEEEECCQEELEDIAIDDEQDDISFDQQEQGTSPTMADLRAASESMKQLQACSAISREAMMNSVLADYSFHQDDNNFPIQHLLMILMIVMLLLCTALVILLYSIV